MEDLLPEFLTETLESLDALDTALVKLELQPGDKATLGAIFRHVHTIKGTCGFLGLTRLEHVAHAAENVLGCHREGVVPVTPGSITVILRALDTIRAIVDGIQATGQEPGGDDTALVAALAVVATGGMPDLVTGGTPDLTTGGTPDLVTGLAPDPVEPAMAAPVPAAPLSPPAMTAEVAVASAPEPAAQTIRVNVDVLEDLMTLVSELVLTRNQILQLARTQHNEAFAGPLQRLSHITSELQEGVMKTRMQPIGTAWGNLPRLVRDLSQELGKKIELVMHGAETELDRQVLELIKDPLTHMVRNSGDHGLETPAERQAAGKPEQGRIRLNAFHEGGHILIEVGDDGRGLAVERIRAKAIANGLATEGELASMTDQQIQSFIFRAGFSTAAAVTSVSGRGVGMDVVKTNVERIGGTIELSSVEGAGTTFTLKIPLTLAIVSALIVEVCNERFAIPQISVVELVRARAAAALGDSGAIASDPVIETIDATPVLRLRDSLLPLVDLAALMALGPMAAGMDASLAANQVLQGGSDNRYIVVVQVSNARFGLVVDRIFDTEEIVLKPVAPILRHISLFSGATILGDGRVIMILDPTGIARSGGLSTADSRPRGAEMAMVDHETSARPLALLLFKSDDGQPRAVPLDLVARLERIGPDAIERSGTELVTQYRGKLMPLVPLSGKGLVGTATHPVLVFADGERVMGLIVDEIVDVVEDRLRIELATDEPGFLGAAIIKGTATDILDTAYWLQRAFKDWFAGGPVAGTAAKSVLVVEDSAFFRSLIIPALSAAGYHVTAVDNPVSALEMRDAGRSFDLILSDIEMPEMNGIAFVREVRMTGAWTSLPVIALSSLSGDEAVARGRAAGFDFYISKFDRTVLLDTVEQALCGAVSSRGSRLVIAEGIAS